MKNKSNHKYGRFSKNNFKENLDSKNSNKKKAKRLDDTQGLSLIHI